MWRGEKISSKEYRVNEQIRVPEVRVIDQDGKQLGVMPTRQAMALAIERGMDLIEVAPNAEPPVCRIVDYGKFAYQRARREREARKAQKTIEVKEIRLRPKTGEHDLGYKMKDARRFLERGDKVRLRVIFRGREVSHMDIAREMLIRLASELQEVAMVEQPPAVDGRTLSVVLAPGKTR
ncbi:MAG: translation initiation factor IF-3 [Anaerolineae bacterium]